MIRLAFLFRHILDLVIENAQVAGDNLILKDRTRWNIDSVSMIRNDNDSSLITILLIRLKFNLLNYLETDILAKRNITRNSQMIGLKHIGNGFEAAREFRHLKS